MTAVVVVTISDDGDENSARGANQPLTISLPVALLSQDSKSPPGLTIEDDTLYLYAKSHDAPVLAAFSTLDGRQLWASPLPGKPLGDPLVVAEADVVLTQFIGGSQPVTVGYRRPDGRRMWTLQNVDAQLSPEYGRIQDRSAGYPTGSLVTALRPRGECCATAIVLDARTGKIVRTAGKDDAALMLPLDPTVHDGQKFVEWNQFSSAADAPIVIRDVATGRELASRVHSPGYAGPPTVAGASIVWVVESRASEYPFMVVATSIADLTNQWSWTLPAIDRATRQRGVTELVETLPCARRVLCVHYFFLQEGRTTEGAVGLDLTNGRELWTQPKMSTVIPVPNSDELLLSEGGEGPEPNSPAESYVLANAITGSILRPFTGITYPIDANTAAIIQSSGPGRLPENLAVETVRLADGRVDRLGTVNTQSELCRFGFRKLVCPTAGDKIQVYSFVH